MVECLSPIDVASRQRDLSDMVEIEKHLSGGSVSLRRHALHAELRQPGAQGCGLYRLVENLDALRTGLVADVRAAVGGDEDGGQIRAETAAQLRDCRNPVTAVEVIVDQKARSA